MKQPDFEVIVVGAGAGGAAAAYYLTQASLKVLVIEKAQLPRYKPCGGAIPRSTLERFPFEFDSAVKAAPSEVRFTFPCLTPVDVALPERPVVMVMRSQFDAFLLAKSDAEILDGTAVTDVIETNDGVRVKTTDRTLTARYLVGADGAASQVARGLSLRQSRRLGGTLQAEVPVNGHNTIRTDRGDRAVFSLGVIPWGYAWVFPKGDCLSVGIGRFRPGRANLRSALRREMERMGIAPRGARLHGHPLPCYQAPPWPWWRGQPQERLSTQRCLLVGDAAGLVDPLIGEGIRYAITSAQLAAEAIIRRDLSGYEAAIWREIGHSLATAGLMADVVYRIPRLSFQIGVRNPVTIHQLVDVLTGELTYQGVGRRSLAATVNWILRGQSATEECRR